MATGYPPAMPIVNHTAMPTVNNTAMPTVNPRAMPTVYPRAKATDYPRAMATGYPWLGQGQLVTLRQCQLDRQMPIDDALSTGNGIIPVHP